MNLNPITELAAFYLLHGAKTITTEVAKLVDANEYRRAILIQNRSTTNSLYVGNADVTPLNTVEIAPGEHITLYNRTAIYAVASADTCDARYIEEYSA